MIKQMIHRDKCKHDGENSHIEKQNKKTHKYKQTASLNLALYN